MTREKEVEIISKKHGTASLVYGKLHNDTLKGLLKHYQKGFAAGVKWADAHPKSPWISTKEDLPCNHEELIFLEGLINGSETIEVFVRYESGDIWSDYMIYENGKWRWNDCEPAYWMIPPKLPKE